MCAHAGSGWQTERNEHERDLTPAAEQRARPEDPIPAWASGVADGLSAGGCRHVVYVPDNPLSHILSALARESPRRADAAGHEGGGSGRHRGRPLPRRRAPRAAHAVERGREHAQRARLPAARLPNPRRPDRQHARRPRGVELGPGADGPRRGSACSTPSASSTCRSIATRTHARPVLAAATLAFGTRVPAACLLARRLTAPAEGGRS